ncbi:MAG: glycine cleavage system protein T, partial [Candidatus Marinimicrobia bacterium]|nr:glycine cleavage system protein T [Candidatus Neomarinimicrobiota bacterium]
TLWDVAVERQVEITGPDAAKFTQLLTPRNLSDCAVNQCKYVLNTNYEGGILSDPILLKLAEDHWWYSISDSDLLLWAMGVAGKDQYDINLVEPDVSPLQVQGPKSKNVMVDLFGSWINDLNYYWCRQTELDDIPVVVSRTGWSGEIGYEIYLRDGSRGSDLYEKIMEAGEPYKIAPTGPSQIRRVEAGIFSYFQDMRVTDNPYEIGMDRLVDLEMEADFVGKEALKIIKQEGIKRKLVGIEILGDPITMIVPPEYTPGYFVPDHWPVNDAQDEEIGHVTSKCFSPRLKKNIGFAFVPIEHANQGNKFFINSPYGKLESVVVELPFWDPKKQIPIGKT